MALMGRSYGLCWVTAMLGMVPAHCTQVLRLIGRVETHIYWVPISIKGMESPNIWHLKAPVTTCILQMKD